MTSLLISILILFGSHDTGWSSRYDQGVMDYVLEYRQMEPPCDGCAIAVLDCDHLGDIWLIRPLAKKSQWTPVIVADCARRDNSDGTQSWMHENNIIFELSYELAVRLDAMNSREFEVIR